MHPKQIENVLRMDAKARYEHFVVRSVDFEKVWILVNDDGFITRFDGLEDVEYLPVWPAKEYALMFEEVLDEAFRPEKIELKHFIEKWLIGLTKDSLMVGTIPNKDNNVWVVNPMDLQADMLKELDQHE